MRIAHSADWQLDQSQTCAGKMIRNAQGDNIRWKDQQRVVTAFVDGAIDRKCNLALVVGDIFERPKPTPTEIEFAQKAVYRLSQHMTVVLCQGNHDPVLGPTDPSAVALLDLPEQDLYVHCRPVVQTVKLDGGEVDIAILPFPTRSILLAKDEYAQLGPEAANAVISSKLRQVLHSFKAQLTPGIPHILMAHVMIQGAAVCDDQTALLHEISLTQEDLEGWNYIALGHVHQAQSFPGGRAWYSGSLDRCSFGEEHNAPGWNLVNLSGGSCSVERIETPARRYLTYRDIAEAKAESFQSADLTTDPIVRVKARISQEEYDALGPDLVRWRQYPLFQEQIEVTRQTTARSEAMTGELTAEGALVEWHRANNRPENLGELLAEHRRLAGAMK
jgi:exonuclease SbcD